MTIGAGSRLGPYEILSPLGAGGMGEVYRARDTRLSREVAIKVLPAEVAADRERLKRFEKEARSASALNHPNIVTIYDIGSADSVSYIAMEKVDGKTLRELLFGGALPIRRLLAIATQIADGLSTAHKAGIVHRDLKPENVMVTRDGLVKILDFGLAKLTATGSGSDEASRLPTETGTSPGAILGTVGYMSPEQAGAQTVDFRSDQFSFGSILYEMATGKRAFQKKTAVETLSAILREDPESVGSVNPQAPAPLRWIVERCLAKDPEDRYASTRDLARELATVRDHLSEASLSGAVLAAAPSRRSSRARAAVIVLALLIALLAGVFGARPVWKARFSSQPTLQQLTFRRGTIARARFAPDGQIIYTASGPGVTGGKPFELFSTRPGTPEPRSLNLPPAVITSISRSGELAVIGPSWTLATMPLAGGAPRELLEDVRGADWGPDGKSLAVAHIAKGGVARLEYPIGKVLYQPPGGRWIAGVEFSPSGDRIAFREGRSFIPGAHNGVDQVVVDLTGKRQRIIEIPLESHWSPRGDEIWFNVVGGGTTSFWGVTLSGRKRFIAAFPGDFVFLDVARDGRLLLERGIDEKEIVGRFPGEPSERNLSWLDGSVPAGLSGDGKLLLFTESGQGGGPSGAVYKRNTDGSDAVRLGEGTALALSPDGLWALASPVSNADRLVLLPTGPGQPRILPLSRIRIFGSEASFFPDGKRILIRGAESGLQLRLYVLEIESAKARPITPEGTHKDKGTFSISPDGGSVILSDGQGQGLLYDVDGGPARPVPGLSRGLEAIGWCADGRSVFVRTSATNPLKVYRLDLASGRQELWREFSVSDIGAGAIRVIPTPDGKSYVYGYTRYFSDLFIAEGLK